MLKQGFFLDYITSGSTKGKGGFIMGAMAAIVGVIGGFCAVIGIITAAEIVPLVSVQFTWMFWLVLSGILLLASIAFIVGRDSGYE